MSPNHRLTEWAACETAPMSEWEDADEGRAPICPSCGVTALPAETANVLDPGFVCDNADCDAFGDTVPS
jgi:hypothetical protein